MSRFMTMWKIGNLPSLGLGLALLFLTGCPAMTPVPTPSGVDPFLEWDAVALDCTGKAITGVTYNVYAVSGPGPIPTAPSPDVGDCAKPSLATGLPLNAQPLTSPSYHAVVPDGIWTFAVEVVTTSGARSGLSNALTLTVRNPANSAVNLRVAPTL